VSNWPPPTAAQAAFLTQLKTLTDDPDKPLLDAEDITGHRIGKLCLLSVGSTGLAVVIRLDTSILPPRAPGGLRVQRDHEDFLLLITDDFPSMPPLVYVKHDRFLGTPHVLLGHWLCLYLNPQQEWHPSDTAVHVLNRLWEWFEEAVTGAFDDKTALFHPVGGVPYVSPGTPTVVVRGPVPAGPLFSRMRLSQRTERRIDLLEDGSDGDEVLVVSLPGPLLRGAGHTLDDIRQEISRIGRVAAPSLGRSSAPASGFAFRPAAWEKFRPPLRRPIPFHPDAFSTMLAATAKRTPKGTPVYFVLAVPASSRRSSSRHLVCGRLPAASADRLRDLLQELSPLAVPACQTADFLIEWCPVSEERPEMTTRRDARTPVHTLQGARVVLLGCGGLGSWIGEFVVRAGATKITLCDPYRVTGGLLVRQDYVEEDIGGSKAEALARRLAAISDHVALDILPSFGMGDSIPKCDLLIDATVNRSVAAALAAAWGTTSRTPLVATVATDLATCTLGLVTLTRPKSGPDPETADRAARDAVLSNPDLETFACFWQRPDPGDELNPAPGCSIPTFHGSAADLAAIAGALTRLIGGNMAAPELTGTHMVAMPHAGHTFGHVWQPFSTGQLMPSRPNAEAERHNEITLPLAPQSSGAR
jgi:hypothetical protein